MASGTVPGGGIVPPGGACWGCGSADRGRGSQFGRPGTRRTRRARGRRRARDRRRGRLLAARGRGRADGGVRKHVAPARAQGRPARRHACGEARAGRDPPGGGAAPRRGEDRDPHAGSDRHRARNGPLRRGGRQRRHDHHLGGEPGARQERGSDGEGPDHDRRGRADRDPARPGAAARTRSSTPASPFARSTG